MKRKPKGNAPDPGVAAWRRQVNRAWTLGRGNLVAKVKINAGGVLIRTANDVLRSHLWLGVERLDESERVQP